MAVEVACWQCHGRLLITTPGVVVACPHCGAHLQWPPPTADAALPAVASSADLRPRSSPEASTPAIAEPVDSPSKQFTFAAAETSSEFPSLIPPNPKATPSEGETFPTNETIPAPVDAGSPSPPVEERPASPSSTHLRSLAASAAVSDVADDLSHFATLTERPADETTGNISVSTQIGSAEASTTETKPPPAVPAPVATPSAKPSPPPVVSIESADKPRMVSMLLFIVVLSYASAMTLAFGYMLYKNQNGVPHQLESLPDIEPPMKNGQVALQLVPESAELPNGHTLSLGQSRRFGNVRVTPLRVTREPIRFEHYTGDPKKFRSPTEPVLKLWVRFENVSRDQAFAPLDRKLLLSNVPDNKYVGEVRSNHFVMKLADKQNSRPRVHIYDLPSDGEWDFEGYRSSPNLSPGETWDTYIPTTEEGIDALEGPLVWRVHIRKGYHPESHNGVTTLFEVRFNSRQIDAT